MKHEQLHPHELDEHLQKGTFRLAFVGMSNAGKSYRSRVLDEELNFHWYEVDACIQTRLGFTDMDDISSWLGFPTCPQYSERAQTYLKAESECTYLKTLDTEGKNLVFDTTGSVIYLSPEVKEWLHDQCLIVHIDVGEHTIDDLCAKYFREPKPVIWGDSFSKLDGEGDMEALGRSYPKLLADRLAEYRTFAHLSVPLPELFDKNAAETLDVIKRYLLSK